MNIPISKILSCFFFIFFLSVNHSFAQSKSTMLIATSYRNVEELQTLFEQSEGIYEFLSDTKSTVFLGLITPQQQELLQKKGFRIQIIEENPDMSKYKLFYSAGINQGKELAYLGQIYELTEKDILVKLNQPTFSPTGAAEEFSMIPLILKEKSQITIVPSPSPILQVQEQPSNQTNQKLIYFALSILAVLCLIAIYIHLRSTKKEQSTPTP